MKSDRKRIDAGTRERRWPLGWLSWRPWLTGMVCSVFILACAWGPVPAWAQGGRQGNEVPPEVVDINTQGMCPDIQGLPKDVKSVKGFSHRAHAERYLKGNSEFSPNRYDDSFTCAGCHTGAKGVEDLAGKDACTLLEAEITQHGETSRPKDHFHKSCLKCHRNMKKAKRPTGPTTCKGCHNRK